MNDTKTIVKLLRAIASGTDAKEKQHDIIFNAGADMLEAFQNGLELSADIIMLSEPGDSRAVSNEAVAIAALAGGDMSKPVMEVINSALRDARNA